MNYKTLIFDFDGTLADTRESIVGTMKFVADTLNIQDPDEPLIKSLIGLPLKISFERAFSIDEKLLKEATSIYRQHYDEIANDTIHLFDGVKDTLLDLHLRGITLAVASSKGKESLVKILKNHHIYDILSFVGGEEDVKNKKPAPDIINLILEKLNANPRECLVVGDTVFDIEMGRRAHIDTCGVTYGNNTGETLKKQNPTYIIDRFKDLTEII